MPAGLQPYFSALGHYGSGQAFKAYLYRLINTTGKQMVQAGSYHNLTVLRSTQVGLYLDDGNTGILLPARFAPQGAQPGDVLKVFVYHDSENRLIATTQQPKAVVGDIARLKVVSTTPQGAFLDWGLMKDLFVPKSQQVSFMRVGGEYLVQLYVDAQTGRVAATERIVSPYSNEQLTVKEMDIVNLMVLRKTDLGYVMAINDQHTGLLHFTDAFSELNPGDRLTGFIKKIRPDKKIDVMSGKPGYDKVGEEAEKILMLLRQHNGFLPYHDKSDPQDIYAFFGMSKKTFKMATGSLFRQHKVVLEEGGIRMV